MTLSFPRFYHRPHSNHEVRIHLSEKTATNRHASKQQPRITREFLVTSPNVRCKYAGRKLIAALIATVACVACTSITQRQTDVRPLVLRDVPAQRLAYRLEADTPVPSEIKTENADDKIETIQLDFTSRRENDALVRTVRSPDGQRALVLYGIADEPSQEFHIDLYSADGTFLRNLTPPDLACVFPETVAWSPDGSFITFIARRGIKPTPTPTPPGATIPEPLGPGSPTPLPSVAPAFAAVKLFATEQIYICNRDGYDLKPLTSREGLIYFYAAWAPDNHAIVAMACKESEWEAREREFKMAAGRPRLITLDGQERLLADDLTEALPVWCPDSSKVATAFDSDVLIYDAATAKPTQARIRLRDALISASRSYEQKKATPKKDDDNRPVDTSTQSSIPASFNPIIRVEWVNPDRLFFETAYVRLLPNEPITTFQRWHQLILSAQAALLK